MSAAPRPSPGVIYPTLTLLDELGYVAIDADAGSSKKLHQVTDEGRAFLNANRAAVDALLARMDEAGRVHGGGPAPQVVRAMENLKLALRMRLARGPLSEEQANTVAAALDAAATGVEQTYGHRRQSWGSGCPRLGRQAWKAAGVVWFSRATIRSIPWPCQRFTALWSAPSAVARRRHG